MIERICRVCHQGNSLENKYCGQCGARLESFALARRPNSSLLKRTQLPAIPVKRVGQAAAVGVLALVVDAGISWLRRRFSRQQVMPLYPNRTDETTVTAIEPAQPRRRERIIGQRVVEVWRWNRLTDRTIETIAVERHED